jgi:hypothetical protein
MKVTITSPRSVGKTTISKTKSDDKQDKFIEEIFEQSMKELSDFFGINWTRNRPAIVILKNRQEINDFNREKTEDWEVAFARNNAVYILDRKNFEKESCYKYSDDEYRKLLKHELTHLYYNLFSKGNHYPKWFEEGLAVFISGQSKDKKVKKFTKFLDYFKKGGEHLYSEGGCAVKVLFEKFGKDKLFILIKNISSLKSEVQFNKKFEDIYGSKPSYDFFNSLI